MVREIQNQVGAAASMPIDKTLALSTMPGADLAAAATPGVVPGGEQALSPLMNMIMKMPGHISLLSSFFEALGNFLMPQLDMLTAFDPTQMGLGLDSLFSPEHMSLDFSLLPDDAPIFGTLDAPTLNFHSHDLFASKLTDLGHNSSHSGFSLAKEIGLKDSLNVSGNLMGKPQFEGALSGPSLSEGGPASHLAANERLFSDNLGEPSSNFGNNIAAGSSSTVNVNGSTFAQLPSSPTAPAPTLPGNQGLDFFGKGDNLLAANNQNHNAFESTISPRAEQASVAGSSKDLGGLSAKPLSLDKAQNLDMKADLKNLDAKHIDAPRHIDAPKHLDAKNVDKVDKVSDKLADKSHKVFSRHSHTRAASAPKTAAPQSDFKQVTNDNAFQSKTDTPQNTALDRQIENQNQAQNPNQLDATKAIKPESGIAEGQHSYTIRSGDCLWNIAKDQLGSAAKWSDIYKMNADVLGANPDLIKPGMTIQVPGADTANIASHYTVKPGDNLFDIAKNQLGDGNKWGELYKNNTEVIGSNPRLIQPGQELNIPGSQPNLQISAQPQALTPQAPAVQQVSQIPQAAQPVVSQVPAQAAPMPEVQSYAPPAQANWQSSSMQNFENMPMGEAQKVIPATSQPDGIIPPAQAADSTLANSLNQGNKAVNSSMGADVLDFLKKRR